MISVTFVCLGNICRSPMAEYIFRSMVEQRGLSLSFNINSRGTSDEEEDNAIYPPAAKVLREHGISGYERHRARQLSLRDIINADYVLVMDSSNLFDVLRLTSGQHGEKIFKLCSFTSAPRDVSDPYYTRDFARAFSDICDGCACFLQYVLGERASQFDYDRRH